MWPCAVIVALQHMYLLYVQTRQRKSYCAEGQSCSRLLSNLSARALDLDICSKIESVGMSQSE